MRPLSFADCVRLASDTPQTYDNCDVVWLDWPPRGSGQTKPTWCMDGGCTVAVKRKTATITRANGEVMRKRLNARGFFFSPQYDQLTEEEEYALLARL